MLISHRRSAYIDDDELERAAGMFEIAAESEQNAIDRSYYAGAACTLRAMNAHDVKTCDDLTWEQYVEKRSSKVDWV